MALDPIVWALKDAPVADAIERLVLAIYAEHADEDGCSAFPSYKTVAERAMTDRRTVIRRVQELVERGLLAEGDPAAAAAIPQRYRPKVYDVMIPYSWWGPAAVDRINTYRVGRGRAPITAATRPAIGPAPARHPRADAGRPRAEGQEWLRVTPAAEAQGCLPDPARGDSQTPPGVGDRHPTLPSNPPQEPPPPPTPSTPPADCAGSRPGPGQEVVEVTNSGGAPARPGNAVMAAELVASLPWPGGRRPDRATRRRLTTAAQACLERGHRVEVVRETAAGGVDGARRPAAVVLTRLRELAEAEPNQGDQADSDAADAQREREQLARTVHRYQPGRRVGSCRCGRPESARVHPSMPAATPTRQQCPHGRRGVCLACADGPSSPAQPQAPRPLGEPPARMGAAGSPAAAAVVFAGGGDASHQARHDGSVREHTEAVAV